MSNNGNVTPANIDLTDPLTGLGALACSGTLPALLAAGAMLDCPAKNKRGRIQLLTHYKE